MSHTYSFEGFIDYEALQASPPEGIYTLYSDSGMTFMLVLKGDVGADALMVSPDEKHGCRFSSFDYGELTEIIAKVEEQYKVTLTRV